MNLALPSWRTCHLVMPAAARTLRRTRLPGRLTQSRDRWGAQRWHQRVWPDQGGRAADDVVKGRKPLTLGTAIRVPSGYLPTTVCGHSPRRSMLSRRTRGSWPVVSRDQGGPPRRMFRAVPAHGPHGFAVPRQCASWHVAGNECGAHPWRSWRCHTRDTPVGPRGTNSLAVDAHRAACGVRRHPFMTRWRRAVA